MFESILVNSFNFSGSEDYISRIKSMVYGQRLFFVHVPKCGGTSLSHFFRLRFAASHFRLKEEVSSLVIDPTDDDVERWMIFKRDMCIYHALAGSHFVQGHVAYDERAFAPLLQHAQLITLLREPMDRVISHYYFENRLNRHSFAEFLDSPRGRLECSIYSRFFGGLGFKDQSPTPEHKDVAIRNLKRFSVVGLIEEPQLLTKQVKASLGLTLRIPKRNVGGKRASKKGDADQIDQHRERLAEMCQYDREIYASVREQAQRFA